MASESVSHSHTLYAQLVSKAQGHENESELYELAQLAGITMDPEVFKIVLDLLEMKCSPKTIADVLHSMLRHSSFNSASHLQLDHSQSDTTKNATSNAGQRTSTSSLLSSSHSTHHPHTVSSPPGLHHNSSVGRSGSMDHSRISNLSNVTTRSNSGDRRAGSQSTLSSSSSTSRLHSRPDSSSYTSTSRGDLKTRKHR